MKTNISFLVVGVCFAVLSCAKDPSVANKIQNVLGGGKSAVFCEHNSEVDGRSINCYNVSKSSDESERKNASHHHESVAQKKHEVKEEIKKIEPKKDVKSEVKSEAKKDKSLDEVCQSKGYKKVSK